MARLGGGSAEDPLAAQNSAHLVWQWVREELVARALVEQIVHEETAGLSYGGRVFDLFVQTALGVRPPALEV